jgi:transposase
VPTTPKPPHTVDSLLRVVEAYEAEVALLKLMVDKLQLQVLRGQRARFGASSEQLNSPQIALIEGQPLDELSTRKAGVTKDAADASASDRKLPAHLPRDTRTYRPDATSDHRDAKGQPCGYVACGGRLRLIGQDVSEQLE